MFIYKNKLYLIFFVLSLGLSPFFSAQLYSAVNPELSQESGDLILSEKELAKKSALAEAYFNKIIYLVLEKTDIKTVVGFLSALESYKEVFAPIELDIFHIDELLKRLNFEALSEKEWKLFQESFSKVSEQGQKKLMEILLLDDKEFSVKDFLIHIPSFVRKAKEEAKLDIQKSEAIHALQNEYNDVKKNSTKENLLLLALGVLKGSMNQEIDMGNVSTVLGAFPILPLLTYRKQEVYLAKKITELLAYLTKNKNYSKSEIAINKAKEDYILEHLGPQIFDDLYVIGSQMNLKINQKLSSTDSRYRNENELNLIPYKNAAGELIKKHASFLPSFFHEPAKLILTSALFNIGPSFVSILAKETDAPGGNKMSLEEKFTWDHLTKDKVFVQYLSSFITNLTYSGLLNPLNATLGSILKYKIRKHLPFVAPLVEENLSSRSMRAWSKIIGSGISNKIDLHDKHYDLKKNSLRKYKDSLGNPIDAAGFKKYIAFKAPETLARNTLNGVLSAGLKNNENVIVETIDSFGDLLASGAKTVLPDFISDRLISYASKAKTFGQMGTKIVGSFYFMYKINGMQEGRSGIISAFEQGSNQNSQKYFFNDKLINQFSKYICNSVYNIGLKENGAADMDKASVSKLAFVSMLWYLFNSGASFDTAAAVKENLH